MDIGKVGDVHGSIEEHDNSQTGVTSNSGGSGIPPWVVGVLVAALLVAVGVVSIDELKGYLGIEAKEPVPVEAMPEPIDPVPEIVVEQED